jgi:serine/threonine protein kinase
MNVMNVIVERKYTILSKLGQGSFGTIYKGINNLTQSKVAIKIEYNPPDCILTHEAKIYKYLEGKDGIPRLLSFGKEGLFHYMIMDLFDESLEVMKRKSNGKLSLNTVLNIFYQALERLETIHTLGIVHRDIKPDNFIVDRSTTKIYMIDFGLSKRFLDVNEKIIPLSTGHNITGSVRYSSIHVHSGMVGTRRDDLESLGYMILYLWLGRLPWQGITHESQTIRYECIGRYKTTNTLVDLFPSAPMECIDYLNYCRRLSFDEKPDYEYIRSMFYPLYKQHHCSENHYDWIKQ